MIALIIIGAIALCLLLLLICPLKVQATMDGEFNLKIKYGPLKLNVLPAKKKPKKEKPEKPKKEKEEGKENPLVNLLKQHGVKELIKMGVEAIKILVNVVRGIFSHIVVYHLHFEMIVASENAFDTAVETARLSSLFGAGYNTLLQLIPPKKRKDVQWSIVPNFAGTERQIYLYAEAGIRPLFVFGYVFKLIFKMLPLLKRFFLPKKKEEDTTTESKTNSNNTNNTTPAGAGCAE